jgi:YetA-like protein
MLAADRNGSDPHCVDDSRVPTNRPVGMVPLIMESAVAISTEQPVTVGIPWPPGLLTCDRVLTLCNPSGHAVPLQTNPLAWWADGSVKWLLVDFIVGSLQEGPTAWSLELHDGGPPPVRTRSNIGLRVEEIDCEILVNTGLATFTMDRRILAPIVQTEIDGSPVLDPTRSQIVLIDAKGRHRRPRIQRDEIETSGPVRTTLRFEGVFEGSRRDRLRFCARVSFFTGLALARVELTVHNPRRALHRGGLWDLGDPGSILFRDLSLKFGLAGPGPHRVRWTEEIDGPQWSTESGTFQVYQDSSGGENWRSRNHVNRLGDVPVQFRGYRVRSGEEESAGLRASPVVSDRSLAGAITAAIPEFWQQFPKAIDTEGGRLNLRLFPGQFGDLFELQGGEQKTHTLWLHFSLSDRSAFDSLSWVHQPARVRCTPDWYSGSGVIPYLAPCQPSQALRYDCIITNAIKGSRSFAARREVIDEYGWRHYGDVYADHESAYYEGKAPIISHYNNQYDVIHGLMIQYFRTGDSRWVDLADPLARHVMDIDIYHTTEDKAAYNGGMFWHTDHYRDAATSTHRTYSRANCTPKKRGYGGGPCNEHNYTTGLLNYYYLTGAPMAREAVLSLAHWVLAMDDGSTTLLAWLDEGPTGLASGTARPDYHGPGRGCGNSINALLDAWLLTGKRHYMDRAEALIRRSVHPDMDIAALDLLHRELRWSYTVFLSVLGRYLGLKIEAGHDDAMYAYARRCLLAFASWMVDNEMPYFDRPGELEYPTETWAAQEFRKANVLRLAAEHASEPLRQRLIVKSNDLTARASTDLLRFESCDTTRSVALVLVEGARDAYWASHPIGNAPTPSAEDTYGPPSVFIGQKERVLARWRLFRRTPGAFLGPGAIASWWRSLLPQPGRESGSNSDT